MLACFSPQILDCTSCAQPNKETSVSHHCSLNSEGGQSNKSTASKSRIRESFNLFFPAPIPGDCSFDDLKKCACMHLQPWISAPDTQRSVSGEKWLIRVFFKALRAIYMARTGVTSLSLIGLQPRKKGFVRGVLPNFSLFLCVFILLPVRLV